MSQPPPPYHSGDGPRYRRGYGPPQGADPSAQGSQGGHSQQEDRGGRGDGQKEPHGLPPRPGSANANPPPIHWSQERGRMPPLPPMHFDPRYPPQHYPPPSQHHHRQQHQQHSYTPAPYPPHPMHGGRHFQEPHLGRHEQQSQQQQPVLENQFSIQPLDRFKVKCVSFRQPIEIGSFSYDAQRNFIMDDSQLKYYFPPDLSKPNNLSVNYEKYISRDLLVDEHIDALLDALICIRDKEVQEHQERLLRQEQLQQQELLSQKEPLTVKEDKPEKQIGQGPSVETPSSCISAPLAPGSQPAIVESAKKIPMPMSMTKADFICYRGILTKIMCTPYTRNEPWELGATLYKGSIYIEEHVTDEKRASAGGSNDRHKLMSYWGYRFETICNISKPVSELVTIKTRKRRKPQGNHGHGPGHARNDRHGQDNDDEEYAFEEVEEIDLQDPELTGRLDGVVDTNLQYCTVARTRIGKNSIIMGAEVDCISEPKKPAPHNPLPNYIELKTSRVISNSREQANFEKHKLLKFWAQSFLPGIPTIIVGFRDDTGNVTHLETLKTLEIPRMVRTSHANNANASSGGGGPPPPWDSTVCLNFLDGVLEFLKSQIKDAYPLAEYTIRWQAPFQVIEVIREDRVATTAAAAGAGGNTAGDSDVHADPLHRQRGRPTFLTERFLNRWEQFDE